MKITHACTLGGARHTQLHTHEWRRLNIGILSTHLSYNAYKGGGGSLSYFWDNMKKKIEEMREAPGEHKEKLREK